MNPKVYIIALNWNMADDTIECVKSLEKLNYDNFRILLVDNGSSDDSVTVFRKAFPDIELIQNKENEGSLIKHIVFKRSSFSCILGISYNWPKLHNTF